MATKSNDILVSVIICAYNRKRDVIESINSVINSKYKNIEIIYVDSKSNDDTVEIVKKLYPTVKILITDKKGVMVPRNMGASIANGSILLFLDSDAKIISDTIDKVVNEFIKDPDLGVVGTKIVSIEDKNTIQYTASKFLEPFFFPSSKHINDNKQYVFQVIGVCFFTTKELFDILKGFDEDLYPYGQEDFDYCWRTWKFGKKILYIPITTYHKGTASNTSVSSKFTIEKNIVDSTANHLLIYIKNSNLMTFIELPIIYIIIILYMVKRGFIFSILKAINLFFKKITIFIKKRSIDKLKWKISDRKIFEYITRKQNDF
ncbi:MAG: glycosyltransferase [Thermoplasmata archaeon]